MEILSYYFITIIISIGLHCVKPYLINHFPKQVDLISKMYKVISFIEILHLFGIL